MLTEMFAKTLDALDGFKGILAVILLWIVCAHFGVYFTRVEDGM